MEDEGEEEISIDLGKIKSFLKKVVQTEETPEEERGETEKEEGIAPEPTIDFGKIISGIKKIGVAREESKEQKDQDEEFGIDFKQIIHFFKINRSWVLPTFFILFAMLLCVYIRLQPKYLPVTDGWARNTVTNYYKNEVAKEINQQYPNLPQANKDKLINEQFNEWYKQNKQGFEQAVSQVSQNYKTFFRDDNNVNYLPDIDSWFWFRATRNIVEKGHIWDKINDQEPWVGVPWDDHMLAPIGMPMQDSGQINFHCYLMYYWYRLMSIFNPKVTLMHAVAYVPVILAMLAVIPIFFITRRIGGDIGGFFAAIMFVCHPLFIGKSAYGLMDIDVYYVAFPLFIAWLFIIAFESKERWLRITLSVANGLLLGLFAFTWIGWWYVFDFILATIGAYIIFRILEYLIIKDNRIKKRAFKGLKTEVLQTIILTILLFLSTLFFVTVIKNFNTFTGFVNEPLRFLVLKKVATQKIWPNVYTTVAELNPSTVQATINAVGMGKPFWFYISIIGIVATLLRKVGGKIDVKYAVFLSLWYATMIYASKSGVRFVGLTVPIFSIALGVAIGTLYFFLIKFLEKELNVPRVISGISIVLILLPLVLYTPYRQGMGAARSEMSMVTDAWYNALTKIKLQSSEGAIVNSWWDFGHWFKAIADRAVTFDGASQNIPQAHWIGRVLLTDNETEAISILRMLDCGGMFGGGRIAQFLNNEHLKPGRRLTDSYFTTRPDLTKQIIMLDRENARKELEKIFTPEQTEEVLSYTHCDPPENYFITSGDMVGKSGVWAHFGSWDLFKADMYRQVHDKDFDEGIQILKQDFNLSDDTATQYYYDIQSQDPNHWISGWPSYQFGPVGCSKISDQLECQNGVMINLSTMEAKLHTQQGVKSPVSIAFINQSHEFQVETYSENTVPISIGLLEDNGGYSVIGMAPELAGSMFTRLFFFRGYGLNHFNLFDYRRSITAQEIYTWKVDWEGNAKEIAESGDVVGINYVGIAKGTVVETTLPELENATLQVLDGLDFSGFETSPMYIELGRNQIHPEIENAIYNMSEGEEKILGIIIADENRTYKIKVERIR